MNKVLGVIQARMGSSRLPGKPLLPLGGTTALAYLVGRLRRSGSLTRLIVATSERSENDEIAAECRRLGVGCFRGSESDVLGRLACAAHAFEAPTVVRITADDVLMDPAVVDFMVARFRAAPIECATGLTTRSFPNGFVVSVLSATALSRADRMDLDPLEREHVIPTFLARRERFIVLDVEAPSYWTGYDLGLTLDTPSDYALLSEIVGRRGEHVGGLEDLLELLARDPELRKRAQGNGQYWEPDRYDGVYRLSRT